MLLYNPLPLDVEFIYIHGKLFESVIYNGTSDIPLLGIFGCASYLLPDLSFQVDIIVELTVVIVQLSAASNHNFKEFLKGN